MGSPAVRNVRVRPELLYVASGWSTLVTDVRGRVGGTDPQGFFADNTRVLSRERITVDGRAPTVFSTADVGAHAQMSYAVLAEAEVLPSVAAYLVVERFVGAGLRTRLRVLSYAVAPLTVELGVEVDADFADTVEAESGRRRQEAPVARSWDGRELLLTYGRSGLDRAVAIGVHGATGVGYADSAFTVRLSVPARGEAYVDLLVEPVFDGVRRPAPPALFADPPAEPPRSCTSRPTNPANGGDNRKIAEAGAGAGAEAGDGAARARTELREELSLLRSTNAGVAAAWKTAVRDLAALPLGEPAGPTAPFAGLPAYQQIFGRDTLATSWQALLAGPTMLRDSLRLNAGYLGRRFDDWRDEEPGKPLHQARRGPVSVLGLDAFERYHGDYATGPDFLFSLGQYLAWTGDLGTVRELMPAARRIVAWLDRFGDLDGDGFLEYRCRSAAGVRNQGWKDSDTAVVDERGEVVENPIATSELQAYWYAALRHGALAFAATGERAYAVRLVRRAAALKRRFHRAFWLPGHGFYAMALGPDGRPVVSASSNDGHLLAAGIVPRRVARVVADRLLRPDMFSGFGVRTLSADHPAYNPFSYHRGSVWPVEAGTLALGLARYGCWPQLHAVTEGLFAAAGMFEGHRLPEVLSGLSRSETPYPGVYPDSCSPQAWSASTVVALVQALLALRPVGPLRTLLVDPHLPAWLPDLDIERVRIGGATFDLRVRRRRDGTASVRTRGDRVLVVRRPPRDARR
ncbi:glycogen debranching N-terminal domain-containing protein [Polymorphospora rubra]|uniref:Amylo-alpha-1,6-glucosidase n=1 Tax=Polymorphospora rubra TaxID=338584 RepID=A0A810MQD8_9ACTN|nr:amylo-alpha-1,6-glucosidase [Polymorphospora rubra]